MSRMLTRDLFAAADLLAPNSFAVWSNIPATVGPSFFSDVFSVDLVGDGAWTHPVRAYSWAHGATVSSTSALTGGRRLTPVSVSELQSIVSKLASETRSSLNETLGR